MHRDNVCGKQPTRGAQSIRHPKHAPLGTKNRQNRLSDSKCIADKAAKKAEDVPKISLAQSLAPLSCMSERPPQPPPTQYETDEVAKKSKDVPKGSLA
jgi:hypothetical protein